MNTPEQVTTELSRIAAEARGSVESVQNEMKSLREQNRELVEKNESLAARFAEFEQAALTTARPGAFGRSKPQSIGSRIMSSEAFKNFVNRESKSAAIPLDMGLKNLVNVDGGSSTSDVEYPTRPARDPGLYDDPRRPLQLLEQLPSQRLDTAVYEFIRLNNYSNSSAEQEGEGAPKAETDFPTELQSVRASTVAHFTVLSEQVLADNAALTVQLSGLMRYGTLQRLEQLVVAGTGQIQGLQEEGIGFTASSGLSLADAISEAQATMDADGWTATHCLMHPLTWHQVRSERAAGGDEQYIAANGWATPAMPSIWSLPVVTSPFVTQGRPILIDASQVSLLDRMAPTIEFFRQDGNQVRENLVTARCELRAALAVYSPSAVRLVSTV